MKGYYNCQSMFMIDLILYMDIIRVKSLNCWYSVSNHLIILIFTGMIEQVFKNSNNFIECFGTELCKVELVLVGLVLIT